MIVKTQKPIEFIHKCDCMVHYGELERAILWYQNRPTYRQKTIFMYGRYPAVSIHGDKLFVHSLLMRYWLGMRVLPKDWCVHHKDGDVSNNLFPNLWLVPKSAHTSFHLRGRKPSPQCVAASIAAHRRRRGQPRKKRINIDLRVLHTLLGVGKSINAIAKHFGCDWSTIKSRIHEHPELLKEKP